MLYDSVNVVVNWVADGGNREEARKGRDGDGKGKEDVDVVNGRLEFFGKVGALSCMVKKVTEDFRKYVSIRPLKSV